jgi:hypothetical protein
VVSTACDGVEYGERRHRELSGHAGYLTSTACVG